MAKAESRQGQSGTYIIAIAVFVVAVAAAYLAISALFGGSGGSNSSLGAFKSAYAAAPRVAIYASDYSGSLGLTGTCADALITSTVQYGRRNSSTIDYFVVNGTSCTYAVNLGSASFNSVATAIGRCLNMSKAEPTVYINYSATNTTVIKPDYLYTAGDGSFLARCGIAAELG